MSDRPRGMTPSRYRKKPVTIQAVRMVGTSQHFADVTRWISTSGGTATYVRGESKIHIHTPEGVMSASAGDWVILGVAGEFYPCRDDIFQQTYEPVTSGANLLPGLVTAEFSVPPMSDLA